MDDNKEQHRVTVVFDVENEEQIGMLIRTMTRKETVMGLKIVKLIAGDITEGELED